MSSKDNPDIQIVREAIELFIVRYFDTIEMSGSVKSEKRTDLNYLSVDLTDLEWDENLEKLHSSLKKYLAEWAKNNISNFSNYVSISKLTIEYLLPEKDGANQNQSKHVKLFYVPAYYYRANKSEGTKQYPQIVIWLLTIWHNLFLRNFILTCLPIIFLILLSIYNFQNDEGFQNRLEKSYDYINIASGIIASFVLGFLITKVISIRQDKLKYTSSIRKLSNKLTYFRNICFNLTRDHTFWTRTNPVYSSYEYANSIKNDITYEEYHYPNYDDDVEYAKFKSFYKKDVSHSVVLLVLQLHMMADDSFLDSGLSYTKFPPNYIYTHSEMERFALFHESNQIWYSCSENRIFPETFRQSHHVNEIIDDIKRIYPKKKIDGLTRELLESVSLDFQYKIIPQLYRLTRMVKSSLPITIRYFVTSFILLLGFGLILPTLTYAFVDQKYSLLSVFVVIGIITHILLSLKTILKAEISLNRKYDYL